ncbi:MAG: hypothetical protein ACLPX8_02750 [Bryobacteraceae bacterium]
MTIGETINCYFCCTPVYTEEATITLRRGPLRDVDEIPVHPECLRAAARDFQALSQRVRKAGA